MDGIVCPVVATGGSTDSDFDPVVLASSARAGRSSDFTLATTRASCAFSVPGVLASGEVEDAGWARTCSVCAFVTVSTRDDAYAAIVMAIAASALRTTAATLAHRDT